MKSCDFSCYDGPGGALSHLAGAWGPKPLEALDFERLEGLNEAIWDTLLVISGLKCGDRNGNNYNVNT